MLLFNFRVSRWVLANEEGTPTHRQVPEALRTERLAGFYGTRRTWGAQLERWEQFSIVIVTGRLSSHHQPKPMADERSWSAWFCRQPKLVHHVVNDDLQWLLMGNDSIGSLYHLLYVYFIYNGHRSLVVSICFNLFIVMDDHHSRPLTNHGQQWFSLINRWAVRNWLVDWSWKTSGDVGFNFVNTRWMHPITYRQLLSQ